MSLYYIQNQPKEITQNTPLYILLHGYGSNEEDLFSFAPYLKKDALIVSVRAPFSMDGYGFAWYSIDFDADMNKFSNTQQAKESIEKLAEFIDEIRGKNNIIAKNVFLIGFSQGAILSYGLAFNYPEKIGNVVAMSGYLNEELLPEKINSEPLKKVRFFGSHGTVDQVVPVTWHRKAQVIFHAKQIKFTYKEYPVGHTISQENFFDFKAWLEE